MFRSSACLCFQICFCLFTSLHLLPGLQPELRAQQPSELSPDFNRDVRPILSNHCYACHGQDAPADRVRLDQQEFAWSSRAVVPGNIEASLIAERIYADDPHQRMPPDETGKPLTESQKQILAQWIRNGGQYEPHWAFRRVVKPPVPPELLQQADRRDSWCQNEIDAFVLKSLREQGLQPSPTADRETLLRRAYQDLLGLLPTPEETDAFNRDADPRAWEKVIDRLLASPHYGERWGRHWLDHARYADSNGYTIDGKREAWPFRDWVIQAINSDMPFDQFTIEQIAGDLLPNPTRSQLVATGFHRNTMINEEGGVKPDQYRNEAIIDRVNTTGAVWLGLTLGCAQCHSHKFDPITHEDYYRLYAYFNSAADMNNVADTIPVYRDEMFGWTESQLADRERLQALEKQLKESEQASRTDAQLAVFDWKWQPAKITSAITEGNFRFRTRPDGALLAAESFAENDTYLIELSQKPEQPITAIRLRLQTDPSLPQQGPGLASNGNFVLTEAELKAGERTIGFVRAWADHGQKGYPVTDAIDGKKETGWAINVSPEEANNGTRMNAAHEAIFVLPAENSGQPASPAVTLLLKHAINKGYLLGCFAIDVSTVTSAELQRLPDDSSANDSIMIVKKEIDDLRKRLPGQGIPTPQMIMRDMQDAPATYIMKRGDFLSPDKARGALTSGVPAIFASQAGKLPVGNGPAGGQTGGSRLELAKWLVSIDNPLTARVFVNRVWARHFGRGLVETDNDFGYQGTAPTHPELLDWLAADWMERGWSMKQLHRTILMSATWQQTSDVTPEQQAADPTNRWLGRQQRFRVEAEIVRDQVLSAAGLLTPSVGGPGFFPPQPEGIYKFTQHGKEWPVSTGPERYRRTMYTTFYRSAPHPLLATFDAPDFSTTCTQRVRSNTPLQALSMANDRLLIEPAVGCVDQVLSAHEAGGMTDEDLCRLLLQRFLTRTPHSDEVQILLDYYRRELDRWEMEREAAAEFVSAFPHKQDGANVLRLAAWSSVVRVIMNTDEFVTRN